MRDFIDEFKYMCSASNTSSRGFYIGLAFGLTLLFLLIIGAAGMMAYSFVKGVPISPMNVGIFAGAIVIFVGFIIWLKRG